MEFCNRFFDHFYCSNRAEIFYYPYLDTLNFNYFFSLCVINNQIIEKVELFKKILNSQIFVNLCTELSLFSYQDGEAQYVSQKTAKIQILKNLDKSLRGRSYMTCYV